MRSEFVKPVAFLALAAITVAISPLHVIMFVGDAVRGAYLRTWWQLKHGRHGRQWLAVYTDGAKWKEHFEASVLPVLGQRAVVINCSSDLAWHSKHSLERQAHAYWAGSKEHTPIVIRFSRLPRSVTCVPFYQSYMALAKRGDTTELNRLTKELCALAGEA